jgi:hypothetical protein
MVTLHFWRVALHWHWPITLLRASWAAISLNHAPVSHVYLQLEFANTKEVRMRVIRRSHKMHYLDFVQQTYSPEFLLCLDTKLALETDRQSGPYTWAIIKVSSEHSRQAVFWLFRNQEIKFLQVRKMIDNRIRSSTGRQWVELPSVFYPAPWLWVCLQCPTLDSNNMYMRSLSRCATALANFIQSPQAQIKN